MPSTSLTTRPAPSPCLRRPAAPSAPLQGPTLPTAVPARLPLPPQPAVPWPRLRAAWLRPPSGAPATGPLRAAWLKVAAARGMPWRRLAASKGLRCPSAQAAPCASPANRVAASERLRSGVPPSGAATNTGREAVRPPRVVSRVPSTCLAETLGLKLRATGPSPWSRTSEGRSAHGHSNCLGMPKLLNSRSRPWRSKRFGPRRACTAMQKCQTQCCPRCRPSESGPAAERRVWSLMPSATSSVAGRGMSAAPTSTGCPAAESRKPPSRPAPSTATSSAPAQRHPPPSAVAASSPQARGPS
mmetsp:Transcript_83584/g.258465  ORF Transcript_83584/g.258465 Transcript_83584/m.258465 type:complete len:300 (+) Transcript_83584:98-997(+)